MYSLWGNKWVYAFLLAALLPVSVSAQVPSTAQGIKDPGQIFLEQERQRRLEQELLRPPADIQVPSIEAPAGLPKDKVCFPIDRINLEGAESLSDKEIQNLTSPYLGTCMGYNAIGALIRDVTNRYIEKGLVTSRALIPEQELKSRTLRLTIMEGVTEAIELNDMSLEDRMRASTAFPGLMGKKFNLKDYEQGLDQMNRLPSSNASLRLWPGEKEGTTKVVIKDSPQDRFRMTVGMDNYGQKNTGERRIRTGFEYDNMFWLNDRHSFFYVGSKDTNALAYNISVPYGYWTFSSDLSYSEYFSVIGGAAEMFGATYNNSFTASRVVYRGTNSQTAVFSTLNVKKSSRLLNDILLTPQPLTVMRLGVNQTYRGTKGVWYGDFTYSRGLTALGAMRDPANATSDTPRAQFNKLDAGITYIRPFDWGRYNGSARAQYAFDTLYGSEQISMGDNSTVRGFSGSVVSGDSGLYQRNEAIFALPEKAKPYIPDALEPGFEPYLFLDEGTAKLKPNASYDVIAGAGGGVRVNWDRFSTDLSIAAPLYRSDGIETEGVEIYLNVTAKVF
ncbi:MAG: Hemolysin activator HlyB [Rickettsiales bacterium]|jgi:hemolysin activation/secretion protein|nr:Hemolysin activator HlyB [Rickettsiales bacterium]